MRSRVSVKAAGGVRVKLSFSPVTGWAKPRVSAWRSRRGEGRGVPLPEQPLELEIGEKEARLLKAKVVAEGANGPTYPEGDAILLDGMMPGMDGYEACRRLKADPRTSQVPVVFLTAKTQKDEVARALQLGAVACLTKPFDPPTLAAELREALGR